MAKPRKRRTKPRKRRTTTRPMQRLKDLHPITLIVIAIAVAALIYFYVSNNILLSEGPPKTETVTTTTTMPPYGESICGDLDLKIDTTIEALAYERFGLKSSATEENKFVILRITAKNEAGSAMDFSGYRMELTASGETYIPMIFNDFEGLTLMDDTVSDYTCDELALAHVSRFELDAQQSVTGCKMFRVLRDAEPESLSLYGLTGMLCIIDL
jgi:hypothetical protein